MSEPIKDGGSAFPGPYDYTQEGKPIWGGDRGMTLRDYFAGKGLEGFLSGRNNNASENPTNFQALQAAKQCYGYADAMLAAREVKGSDQKAMLEAMEVIRTVATEPHHENALSAIRDIAANSIAKAKGGSDE